MSAHDPGERAAFHDLGDGCFAYVQHDGSWGWSNAGLVVGDGTSLLVDTLFDLTLTARMLETMRGAVRTAPIGTVINTHANGDHCYGNELIGGAEIIASAAAAEEMAEVPPALLASLNAAPGEVGDLFRSFFGDFEFEGITFTPPTRTFVGRLDLEVGGRVVELIEVGPAHTRGDSIVVVPYALLFSVLLALSVIDLELYILPNKITYPSIIASIIAIPVLSYGVADDPVGSIIWSYAGGLMFAGILLITLLGWELIVHKEGMGMGDVKLALLLGIWLGWLHPILPLAALIASSIFGLVAGLGIFLVRRESRPFPFGPYLALGTVAVILFSGPIVRFYGFDGADDEAAPGVGSTSSVVVVDL